MLTQLERARLALLDIVFPRRCLGCGSGEDFLCQRCIATLPRIQPPICNRCGAPYGGQGLCARCQEASPGLTAIRSMFAFTGLARESVHSLKYRNFKALAGPLGTLMAAYVTDNALPVDIVMPVPLHPKRLRERGYNQSALLAEEVSKQLGLALAEGALQRTRYTPPQARSADAIHRKENVRRAFLYKGVSLSGRRILLIDDVCTTGATLEACAEALKEAAPASVWALTLAREI